MSPNLALAIRALLSRLKYLRNSLRIPRVAIFKVLTAWMNKLLENPHISEFLRLIFLGTVVETTRVVSNKILYWTQHLFVVKASFSADDFAYDWVTRFLEDQKIWSTSRVFQVRTLDPRYDSDEANGEYDPEGKPQPFYQPAKEAPEFFTWRGKWLMVNTNGDGTNASLTLSVLNTNRKILDEFVREARKHYFNSPLPPRKLYPVPNYSGAVVTARFNSGDASFDWMVEWVQSHLEMDGVTDFEVTSRPSDLTATSAPRELSRPFMAFRPASGHVKVIKWRGYWLQFNVDISRYDNGNTQTVSGSIYVTAHTIHGAVLAELVEAAREEYMKTFTTKVAVHLAEYGSWSRTVHKSRRGLHTLMLPDGTKEMLLSDIREFLASEKWYTWAGVPHRRGYLLYGPPGTGKSTTIHAIATELNLEVYYIQLAGQGMDDITLQNLISYTPARSILLLEDVDCALQARENDEDTDEHQIVHQYDHVSNVTLSGLLNALDSVTSEEGRIIFATTNHIEKLDPALIREGRMDLKIEYTLSTRFQIQQTFLRFYLECGAAPPPAGDIPASWKTDTAPLTPAETKALAEQFADQIPALQFSLAQIQGFLLRKKNNPRGAVDGVKEWVAQQEDERRKLEEKRKKKRKDEIAERKKDAAQGKDESDGRVKDGGSGEEKADLGSDLAFDTSARDIEVGDNLEVAEQLGGSL